MRKLLIVLFLFASAELFSQEDPNQLGIFEENSVLYRSQRTGGLIMYSNGLGGNFYWGKHLDGFKRRMLGIEITTVKHPKEVKQYNPYYQDAKSYVFGKLNSVIALRPTYGFKFDKYDKLRENGVQVGYFIGGGPVIAFLKPIYLQIMHFNDDNNGNPFNYDYIEAERYNPNQHSISNIYGRASNLKGIDELRLNVGIHLKAGAHFEYAPHKTKLRALEVGVAADIFPAPIEIMASETNQNLLLNIYLNLLFGNKYKE